MSSDLDNPLPGLAPPGQAPSRRLAARRILERCWEPIRLAIEPHLGDLPTVALGHIAKTGDKEEARPAKFVIANARNFQQQFPIVLEAEIRAAIMKFVTTDKAAEQKRGPMTLVEYDAVEDTTAMECAASRLRNAVEDEYTSVRLRLANLVSELEVRDAETPFRPYVFMHAVFGTLDRIGLKRNQLADIVRSFDAALVAPLAAAYAAIDHHLAGQGISAEFARQAARNTAAPRNGLLGGVTENALNGPTTLSKLSAEQMLTALYQHMHLPTSTVPALPLTDAERAMPATARPPTLQVRPPTLSGRPPTLTALAPFAAEAKTVNADVNLINAINDAQRLGALALATMQQGGTAAAQPANTQIRSELAEKAVKQIDKLTIEIVGLLFERIQQDKLVPEAIKDLLQRLQFPLLKVAVIDPDLFVSADQPARRLLDRIAATSIGWTPEGEQNQRYLQAVKKAVITVLSARDDAAGAFERALEGFEQFLEEETARDDDPVARARRALAEAEQREMMAIDAASKIRSAFEGVRIESYLREFLLDVWGRVLVAATIREQHDPAIARRYLAVVPELVWSVQPKVHPDDRRRLVGTIPPVLTALREGLTLINWPKPKMQEFFSRLMQSHAAAVKALELAHGTVPAPAVEASTLRIKLDGVKFCADRVPDSLVDGVDVSDDVVKQVIADRNVDVEHIAAPADTAVAADEVKLNRTIAGWQRGDWFEMRVGDRTERLQLRWISPRRTLFLFAPAAQSGAATRSLTPAALRAFLRNGRLSTVAAAPLFERAVRDVMAELQHATGANEIAHAF